MARHRADWWRKRADEVAAGGDADVIARRHGVRASTLRWWGTEFRRRAREAPESATFLPMVVAPAAARAPVALASDVDIVVEVGAGRLSLRGAVSAAYVEAIIRGLASRC
jgi:transposase-like protein